MKGWRREGSGDRGNLPGRVGEGVIETESGEEISIKLLDTVTQAKEKVLDALYRNTPVSKRPHLTNVPLGECVRVWL